MKSICDTQKRILCHYTRNPPTSDLITGTVEILVQGNVIWWSLWAGVVTMFRLHVSTCLGHFPIAKALSRL